MITRKEQRSRNARKQNNYINYFKFIKLEENKFGFSFDFLILDIFKMSNFDFYRNTFSKKKRKSGFTR